VGSFEDRVVRQSVVHMPMEGAGLGSSAPKVEHGRAGRAANRRHAWSVSSGIHGGEVHTRK
jgi:outer membrane protein OmpA-like peptidoglycan-associated protein